MDKTWRNQNDGLLPRKIMLIPVLFDMFMSIKNNYIACKNFINFSQNLKPRTSLVTLGNFVGEKYILVSANVDARSQTHTSSCVIDIETGASGCISKVRFMTSRCLVILTGVFVSGTFAYSENGEVQRRIGEFSGMGALLQEKDEAQKRLQFIVVGENGDCEK